MTETPQEPRQMQLQVEMDDATAQGVYANLIGIMNNDTEFIMDFLFLQPGQPKAKVRSRIISSPVHAKRMLVALSENIRKYEERFGLIVDRAAAPQAHS